KYSTDQLRAAHRKRRNTRPQIAQTIQVSPESCRSRVSLSTAAMTRPMTAQATGASRTAGCLRTVMTSCSCGSRYRSTSAGGVPGDVSLIRAAPYRLQGVQERRDGAASLLQQAQKVVDGIAGGCRLGKEIPRQKHDDRPTGDLLDLHGLLLRRYIGLSTKLSSE